MGPFRTFATVHWDYGSPRLERYNGTSWSRLTATSSVSLRGMDVVDTGAPIAVPVGASEPTFKAIRHGITEQMLVMDVGSTKGDVIEAARNGLQSQFANFVPAHPIAGKEVSGIEHAEASLYTGRKVVLTPVKATLRSNVQRASQLWSGIGANVVTMTHEEHDSAFAAVSHLPHLLGELHRTELGTTHRTEVG